MLNIYTKQIEHITLSLATRCNLNCSYCHIQESSNKEYAEEIFNKTIKSLENKEFLITMQKVLKKMEVSTENIKGFDIWG